MRTVNFLAGSALLLSLIQPVFALAETDLALAPSGGSIENTAEADYEVLSEEPGRGDISSSETAESERYVALLNDNSSVPAVNPFFAGISTILTLGTENNLIAVSVLILVLIAFAYLWDWKRKKN